jgi:zinc transporter ZupT
MNTEIVIIIADLKEKLDIYHTFSNKHKRTEKRLRVIYYTLGILNVVASITVSCMTGAVSFSDTSGYSTALFILALVSSIFTGLISFTQLEELISKHHSTSGQYGDLVRDIRTFLLTAEGIDSYKVQEQIVLEKDKFISSYAPSMSDCMSKQ